MVLGGVGVCDVIKVIVFFVIVSVNFSSFIEVVGGEVFVFYEVIV